jgi:Rrf2 family protein
MFELAIHYPSDKVIALSEIAQAQDIPIRFLELIIAKLRKEGYVYSQRGQSGGYVIAKPPTKITVGEIFRAMEGQEIELNCSRKGLKETCDFSDSCIFKSLWGEARAAISQVFDTKTLQDLVDKRKQGAGGFDYGI